jgi:hypothetical protein|tara:strand:+ start:1221 stop:1535 length:315 start_codon:yes stop_codon:yes gene_type:complete
MDKIKGQLAGVAALLGVIAAIGGGFVKYGEITTKLKVLEQASKTVDLSIVAVMEEKIKKLESKSVDTSGISRNSTAVKILEKEIELLKIQMEEIKVKASNPLAN